MATDAVGATGGGACPRCMMLVAKVWMGVNALVAAVGVGGVDLCSNAVVCSNMSILGGVDRICVS